MSTTPVVVAVIGMDQPGVVACVSERLTALGCNIIEMTQSTLRKQLSAIYIVDCPEAVALGRLQAELEAAVAARHLRLSVVTRAYELPAAGAEPPASEPFVVSVYGADRNDLVGTFARIFGCHGINIENLHGFQTADGDFVQVFEVAIPLDIDTKSLHKMLLERARHMNLQLTMQHRDIFEAVHRVAVF
ncbi:MAG: hypothetical protein HUK26_08955 [Duodenibacillus sp.]|nr:hypothetical protein [Duodenibacillus sp.]